MKTFAALFLVMALSATVTSAEAHSTSGKVVSIAINDPGNPTGLTGADKRYAVAVRLDSESERLMGLPAAADGQLSDVQKEMTRLLEEAFQNDWNVTIRWESTVKTYALILSVTVSKK